ncbi:hypothetical protein IAT38_007813 [Cryptococcus sp. DSM 104549]
MPSSVTSLPSPTSDDEFGGTLSDSWMEVETSSVGPSVLDDLSDDSGFDSHDHDSRSESSAYSESDIDVDTLDPSVAHPHALGAVDAELDPDTGYEAANELDVDTPSLAGGSYVDAEASTSKLGSSVDTIQQGLESTSSSQIRLIFPDPRSLHASPASLGSAPGDDGVVADRTPSYAGLRRSRAETAAAAVTGAGAGREGAVVLPGGRRSSSPMKKSVDESWLRSSRLWAPDVETPGKTEYRLLSSYDDMEREEEVVEKEEEAVVDELREAIADEVERTSAEEEQAGFAALGKDDLPVPPKKTIVTKDGDVIRHPAKRWSTGMSLVTLLGVLSALSVGFFAPGLLPLARNDAQRNPAYPTVLPIAAKPPTIWERISPLPTGRTTDLQLIKQALSTLSTAAASAQSKVPSGGVYTVGSTADKPRQHGETTGQGNVKPFTRCFSASKLGAEALDSASASSSSALALTSPAQSGSLSIYQISATQRWGKKLLRANRTARCDKCDGNSSSSTSTRSQLAECTCSLSTLVHDQLLPQIRHSLAHTGLLARSGARNFVRLLEQEMQDLVSVAVHAGEAWRAAGRLVLARATRGVHIVRSVYADLRSSVTSVFERPAGKARAAKGDAGAGAITQVSLEQTQAVLDQIAEYAEHRFDAISVLLDEQAVVMQEKAGESIRKAKKGLDRVIRDAAKGLGKDGVKGVRADGTDVEKDGPLPFKQMGKMAAGYLPANAIMLTNVPVVNERRKAMLVRRLSQLADKVGVVVDEGAITVPWDDEAKISKGFVYVSLPDAPAAEAALRALDGAKFGKNYLGATRGTGRVERTASLPSQPQQPAKAKRVLSAIYHGAVALVV